MSKIVKPPSAALFPMPTVLVSCGTGEQANIITLAWVGVICSEPPTVGISVRPSRHSHRLIQELGEFVVNVPAADQLQAIDYCGHVSGRETNKWAACGFTPVTATKVRVPVIAECPLALECRVRQVIPLGSHDLFIGEVVAVHADEDVLDARGRIDWERRGLITYTNGEYYRLGESLGRWGFSRASAPQRGH